MCRNRPAMQAKNSGVDGVMAEESLRKKVEKDVMKHSRWENKPCKWCGNIQVSSVIENLCATVIWTWPCQGMPPKFVRYALLSKHWQMRFGTPESQRHNLSSTAEVTVRPWTTREEKEKKRKRKDKLLSHLSSFQFHPLFSVMAWFKATVWEWAFAAHNNVIIWFAAQEWVRRLVPYVPTRAMWNCCAKIHRGAVYCGTAHSSHCFCALNDRPSHNGIKLETLCQCDMHADWKFTGPEVRN